MDHIQKLLNSVNRCLVPKLVKNYDESNEHPEFDLRNRSLEANFQCFVESLGDITKADLEKYPQVVGHMFILYKELSLDRSWNTSKAKDVAQQLSTFFEVITTVHLDKVLCKNNVFDAQKVFDKCLESIHSKLTYDTLKLYPAQIEVYISIMENLKEYDIKVVPTKIFPITMLLMEDYSILNKKKGLRCCSILLHLLNIKDFHNGNYHEVIYRSLKKNLGEKDIDIVKLTHSCLLALLNLVPISDRTEILDELYSTTLEQLFMDSNLYKKTACFNFTSSIIEWHRENCMNRHEFKQIVCDNLDVCTSDAVSEIMLSPLLKCLEKWITYCWPVWKYKMDHKMLAALFKVLYICKDEDLSKQIHKLIVILCHLCTSSEQEQIIHSFNKKREVECEVFRSKINKIRANFK